MQYWEDLAERIEETLNSDHLCDVNEWEEAVMCLASELYLELFTLVQYIINKTVLNTQTNNQFEYINMA